MGHHFRFILLIAGFLFSHSVIIIAQSGATTDNTVSTESTVAAAEEVYFDFGKADLRSEDIDRLERILEQLRNNEYVLLKITAHTDAIGTDGDNQLLSQKRGEAVKTFLIEKGVPDSLIQVAVYGETAPIASNDDADGRQRNRRATLEVIQQKVVQATSPKPKEPKESTSFVEGTVIDKTNGDPLSATVIIRSKNFKDSIQTDDQGYFKSEVPINAIIGIDVYAPGYFFETQMMKVTGLELPTLEFQLPPASTGEIAEIKDLFFHGNKAILLKKSEPTLPKVLLFMQVNSDIKIEIGGHVNYPHGHLSAYRNGAGEFEQELSDNRAKMVYDYLIQHGISEDRISWKGYSNTQMKFPNAKYEKEMAQNRRVEIKVLGDEK